MSDKVRIIAVVGPESTGKTTLSKALTVHFNGSLVPEFSRIFLERRNGIYSQADLITIAQGQLNAEQEIIKREHSPIFCDTDIVVILVWSVFKYGAVNEELKTLLAKQVPRKYLLMYPDLPWENDPLRENPKDLMAIFNLYVKTLDRLGAEYRIVKGVEESRTENAIDALKQLDFG